MKLRKILSGAVAVTLSAMLTVPAVAAPSDIYGHWAQSTIEKWLNWGYVTGYPDGLFHPNAQISRAEFVTLANYAKKYTQTTSIYFVDVPSSFWGYSQIAKGVAAGYVSGDTNNRFRPNDPVTRQEAAVMVANMCNLGVNPAMANGYTDAAQMANWAKGSIGAALSARIMTGNGLGQFRPTAALSRAEAVSLLDRVISYSGNSGNSSYVPPTTQTPTYDTNGNDVTLTSTSMSNRTVQGDLIISSSLDSKSISLDNVTVKGTLRVLGGGTITAEDCDIADLSMENKGSTFKAKDSTIENTKFVESGNLEGDHFDTVTVDEEFSTRIEIDAEIDSFVLDAETDIKLLSDTTIDTFEATKNADRAKITFSSAEVDEMILRDKVTISGSGKIRSMTVYVSGIESSIEPNKVYTKNDADKPDIVEDKGTENLTADSKKTYTGKYKNVTVTKSGVELKNMTISGRLTIDSDVGNGEVTLNNVTVKGYTNIEGGGDSSIYINDCTFEDVITVDKSSGETPALKFDSNTVKNMKHGIVVEGNGAILQCGSNSYALPSVEIATSKAVDIKVPVKTLIIKQSNNNITLYEKVDTLDARQSTSITTKQNGSISNTTGSGSVTINGNTQSTVTLNKSNLTLNIGQSEQLIATVNPSSAKVTWSSNSSTVATVDANGTVTGKSQGTAVITASTTDGNKATCTVTVGNDTVPVTEVKITGENSVEVGKSIILTASVVPNNATNQKIAWSCNNQNAELSNITDDSKQVKVTGKTEGEVIVTATVDGKSATHTVKIEKATIPVDTITIKDPGELKVDDVVTLKAEINPPNATNQEVTWSITEGTEFATINEKTGELTCKQKGKITVRAAVDSTSTTRPIEISEKDTTPTVESVTITSPDQSSITMDDTLSLTATIAPGETGKVSEITWNCTSSDGGNATFEPAKGATVTLKPSNKGTIQVTASVDGKTSAPVTITIAEGTSSP